MNRPVYRFATFRLDVAKRELYADGVLRTLSPKVFDGLVWLIEHRDRAVGRDELIAAIWGRADVTDAQLGQLMRKLRRTIGDAGDDQAFVRTVPRFGYRWVAPTEAEATPPADAASTSAPTSVAEPHRRPGRGRGYAIAAALLLAVLAAAFWQLRRGSADARDIIAVLPVAVTPEGGRESAWLRLGLMDQIAGDLRAAGLRVVPSDNIAATARNDGKTLLDEARVGTATGAGRFVAATVQRVAGGWVCRIEWREGGRVRREIEASGDGAADAARKASRQLLLALGKALADSGAEHGDAAPPQWLERIDAALLDTDYAGARELLEAAPANLRDSVAWQLRLADTDLATQRMAAAKQGYLDLLARPAADLDATTHARALLGLAGPLAQEGDLPAAQARLAEAIALLEGANAPQLLGEAFYGRGMFALVQGHLDEADADFARARIAFELAGASLQLARLQGQQANLLSARGRTAEAFAQWSAAADRFERFGDAEMFVDALGNAAIEQLALLQAPAAQATIARAEPWLARLDQPLSEALFRFTAARVQARNGHLQVARGMFEALLADPATAQVTGMEATLRTELAEIALAAGDAATAVREAAAAMARLRDPELASPVYARIRHDGELVLIRALRAVGDAPGAAAEARRFREQSAGDDSAAAYAALAEAETLWPGDRAAGRRAYEAALAAARRDGVPATQAAVIVSYAEALLAAGEIGAAMPLAGQAGSWADGDYACALLQARLYAALGQPEALAQALGRVRALAGERPLPADLAAAARPPR